MDIVKIKGSDTTRLPDNRIGEFVALGFSSDKANESVHVDMEQLRGNTAFVEWQKRNPGKTYDDWIELLQEPANEAAKKADDATDRLNDLSDHRDKIINGEWWHWNENTREYENTHESAKGNVLYATLELDPMTGILYMIYDPEYKGAKFAVEDGILYSVING